MCVSASTAVEPINHRRTDAFHSLALGILMCVALRCRRLVAQELHNFQTLCYRRRLSPSFRRILTRIPPETNGKVDYEKEDDPFVPPSSPAALDVEQDSCHAPTRPDLELLTRADILLVAIYLLVPLIVWIAKDFALRRRLRPEELEVSLNPTAWAIDWIGATLSGTLASMVPKRLKATSHSHWLLPSDRPQSALQDMRRHLTRSLSHVRCWPPSF